MSNDISSKMLYISPVYIETIKRALNSIYNEEILECIELVDFNKTNEEYNLELINTITHSLNYLSLDKSSGNIIFTDEFGNEKIIYW